MFTLTDVCRLAQIELLDTVALNLHRIDKDVQRCDRNYYYFTTANLEKLRNIMCRCESHDPELSLQNTSKTSL